MVACSADGDLCARAGNKALKVGGPEKYMRAFLRYPCGALTLFNYPRTLRDLPTTDDKGATLPGSNVDLAAVDIWRDRERGVPKYNEFRRQINMLPMRDWKQLTRGNQVRSALQ
jgi:alpha-dioxygenase